MDINELYTAQIHEDGMDVQLVDPKGEKIDAFIKMVGPDSKTYKNVFKWVDKGGILMRSGSSDFDMDDYSDAKVYAKLAKSWSGLESNGKPVEFNQKNVEALFENAPYLLTVIKKTITDRVNFIKG
ncbi:MAG: hypothetical protein RQ783_08505 [Gammaproteobacteria bacterium]|nr:hypothetical protein [Gammaproteobacteria bacterium]